MFNIVDAGEDSAVAVTENTRAWSLQRRITRRMLQVLGVLWVIGSAFALAGVWHETGTELDSSLNETAERF